MKLSCSHYERVLLLLNAYKADFIDAISGAFQIIFSCVKQNYEKNKNKRQGYEKVKLPIMIFLL